MFDIPEGWWLYITPLAKIDPKEEWILGVLRKGKRSWVTETCKDGFKTSKEAYDWGINFINNKLN